MKADLSVAEVARADVGGQGRAPAPAARPILIGWKVRAPLTLARRQHTPQSAIVPEQVVIKRSGDVYTD